jgi:hypothetical protein
VDEQGTYRSESEEINSGGCVESGWIAGFEDGVEENSQKVPNIRVTNGMMVNEMLEEQGIRQRGQTGSGCHAGDGDVRAGVFGQAAQNVSSIFAKRALAGAQSGVGVGMTNGEELEFERKKREAAVGSGASVVLAQSTQPGSGIGVAFDYGVHFVDAAADPKFEQSKKNVLFAFEVSVKRAAGVSGQRGDISQARCFKAIAREDCFRRGKEFAASRLSAQLLPRGRQSGGFGADAYRQRVRRSGNRFAPMLRYMHVCMLFPARADYNRNS